jgi:competence protein ComEC
MIVSVAALIAGGWCLQQWPLLPDLTGAVVLVPLAHRLRCSAGERWEWDGVAFEMLHPDAERYNDFGLKDNDRGCVLRIVSPCEPALLPADIERRSEIGLLRNSPGRLSADALIAPHHRSRTFSTPELVRAVAPRLVVFSVGYRNRFWHPHAAAVRR